MRNETNDETAGNLGGALLVLSSRSCGTDRATRSRTSRWRGHCSTRSATATAVRPCGSIGPSPTVAFGARDRFLDGFRPAIEAARSHGFTPALRTLGGRAAAYHPGSIVIDHIEPTREFLTQTQDRFVRFGEMYAAALRGIGIDARMGEIPGEYCPGEHSVNVGGEIKAIGTAQRVVGGAWLFSSSIIVEDPDPIRAVLTDVQAALGLVWEPRTGGAISELHPDVTADAVEEALLAAYAREYELVPGTLTPTDAEAARGFVDAHLL